MHVFLCVPTTCCCSNQHAAAVQPATISFRCMHGKLQSCVCVCVAILQLSVCLSVCLSHVNFGKNIKIVATRCQILMLKCTKFDFGWGSAPDPAGGSLQRSPGLLLREGEGGSERKGKGKRRAYGCMHGKLQSSVCVCVCVCVCGDIATVCLSVCRVRKRRTIREFCSVFLSFTAYFRTKIALSIASGLDPGLRRSGRLTS